ncbi:MAG: 50S ribosomal protein L22 [bacterium]
MTKVKSVAKYLPMTSRKAKLVVDLIRGKDLEEAINLLKFTPRAASPLIEKALRSAMANARQNSEIKDVDRLYVSEVSAQQGPTLKRFQPRARGRAFRIRKRTSHVSIVLQERS